jgi:uncharacterized protein (TIGR02284 family)
VLKSGVPGWLPDLHKPQNLRPRRGFYLDELPSAHQITAIKATAPQGATAMREAYALEAKECAGTPLNKDHLLPFANIDIMEINDLLAATADNIDGYTEAKAKPNTARFMSAFSERILERQSILTVLQSEVRRLGGKPEQGGTMFAGAHRMVANLISVFGSRDERAVIDEIGRGEDHLKAKFETAMNNPDLSSQAAQAIRECFVTIRQGHDRMRDIKQAMEGGR